MKPNPMIRQCVEDRHGECCADQYCRTCGAHVSGYNANESVIAIRPEAAGEDWWIACDNADCEHAYGEGLFQLTPEWVDKRPGPM